MPNKEWERLYMGDEGEYTFFIDAVNKKFAVSSLADEQYDLMDDVDDMFRYVKNKGEHTSSSIRSVTSTVSPGRYTCLSVATETPT